MINQKGKRKREIQKRGINNLTDGNKERVTVRVGGRRRKKRKLEEKF